MVKVIEEKKYKYDIIALSNCTVQNEEGLDVRLSSLWQKRPAIFVFLRNFACIACRAHAVEVWARRHDYQKYGARIHFVGNGDPSHITHFKSELGIHEAFVFTNPSLDAFRAAGFKRGFRASIGPRAIYNGLRLAMRGHHQMMPEATSGDLWQLGGILVIHTDGRVGYQFISQSTGDFPPENDIPRMGLKPAPWVQKAQMPAESILL